MWIGVYPVHSYRPRYDKGRVEEVGPDRACAEWLLRCGAHVKWKGKPRWETDYNALPPGNFDKYKIEEVNADDSAVMSVGFKHFEGTKHIRKVRFKLCPYLDDEAMNQLRVLKDSLQDLEISSCDISDRGLGHLTKLANLQKLLLYDLPTVKDKPAVKNLLHSHLQSCHIEFPDIEKEKSGT